MNHLLYLKKDDMTASQSQNKHLTTTGWLQYTSAMNLLIPHYEWEKGKIRDGKYIGNKFSLNMNSVILGHSYQVMYVQVLIFTNDYGFNLMP